MPNGLFPAPINFFLLLLKSNIKILLLSGLAIYAILFFSSKSIPAGFFPPLNDEIILYFSSSIKSILFVNWLVINAYDLSLIKFGSSSEKQLNDMKIIKKKSLF